MAQKYLFPWNWFRGSFAVDAMISKLEAAFGKGTLNLLPDHPRFVICGTEGPERNVNVDEPVLAVP